MACELKCTLSALDQIQCVLDPVKSLTAALSVDISAQYPVYKGSVEITPSQQAQILATKGHLLKSDITINPIPNNYGLITWNGSVLTVS